MTDATHPAHEKPAHEGPAHEHDAPVTIDEDAAAAVVARAHFDDRGLLPAVVQQWDSREVLMLGYMDAEALRRTLTTGRVTYWSRSRQEYWRKGDTSGNVQLLRGAELDCDADTLLLQVEQIGPACHTGAGRCFDVDPFLPLTQPADPRPEEDAR
ncbi:MAG: phosphoribosyl-AMP cyclohydrolase [Actinomycetes bacterium]